MKRILLFLKDKIFWSRNGFFLVFLVVGAFFIYSYLSFETFGDVIKLNSPDETANYFFSNLFAEQNNLAYWEPLNQITSNVIHPRSMLVANGLVSPIGFLGMIVIYGFLGKIIGSNLIIFFTPFFAAVSLIGFYFLIKNIFDKRIGLFSVFLLAIHPAYWYYSARSMMTNVFFTDLLIFAFLFLVLALKKKKSDNIKNFKPSFLLIRIDKWLNLSSKPKTKNFFDQLLLLQPKKCFYFFLAGLFFGIAASTRLSEFVWLSPLVFIIFLICFKRLSLIKITSFILGLSIPLLIFFGLNYQLYGGFISTGYKQFNNSQALQALSSNITQPQNWWQSILDALKPYLNYFFPFGFYPEKFSQNYLSYFINFFWWFTIPGLIGLVLYVVNLIKGFFQKKVSFTPLIFFIFFLVASFWLVAYYGSWIFYDNIDIKATTIGNSYIRYWLILYLMTLPYVAMVFAFIYDRLKQFDSYRWLLVTIIISAMTFFSFQTVLVQGNESLLAIKNNLLDNKVILEKVKDKIPSDAIIITTRNDKVFYPQYRVANMFDDFKELEFLKPLLGKKDLYYYYLWDPKAAQYLNGKIFKKYDVKLVLVDEIKKGEYLYKVEPLLTKDEVEKKSTSSTTKKSKKKKAN